MIKKPLKNISGIKSINISTENENIIFTILQKYIKLDSKVLICVSWWADSIFLSTIILKFFEKNKISKDWLYFLHLNHNTRKNNINDQTFIESFFKWYNLIIKKRWKRWKLSENELRKRRYSEIKNISEEKKIDIILFWHNLTDRIESSFLNILRGCGLEWFKSMQAKENHHILKKTILRPLINLSKDEISNLCNKNKIPYVRDETNSDPDTSLRNHLRLKIFPQLYEISNKKAEHSNTFIKSFQKIYENLDEEKDTHNIFEKTNNSPYRNCNFAYKLSIFKSFVNNEIIINILKNLDIYKNSTQKTINEISNFIRNKEEWFKYFNWTYFFISHKKIYIIQAPKNFWIKSIDKKIPINNLWKTKLWKLDIQILEKECIWWILRFPQKWDKFKNKTRNQYCISQKIPVFRRNFIPIIEKNWKIIKTFKDLYI